MLRAVFAECVRTLEPGGRIAVNVANLGRKPYRSLSADVIRILEDDLHLLRRLGCDYAQGFHFSHPLPLPDLVSWLDDHRNQPFGP